MKGMSGKTLQTRKNDEFVMATPSKKSKRKDPSYGRVGSNRYPVEQKFTIVIGANTNALVDVAKCLSAVNRRLYRQGKIYTVKIEMITPAPDGVGFTMKAIPNTWMVKKAWELAHAKREEQLNTSSRRRGRWDDFRVGWSSALQTGIVPKLADFSTDYTIDECNISKIHDATDSVDNGLVMWGAARDATNNLYGIIEQYDQIGNTLSAQPGGNPTTDAYTTAYADGTLIEAAGDLATEQGDDPPYDADGIPGATDIGATVLPIMGQSSSGNGSARNSYTVDLPLGLLKIENGNSNGHAVLFTVMKGDYKGVKALDW